VSLSKMLIDLGRKPSGCLGRLIGGLMNRGHRDSYVWGIEYLSIKPDSKVLDVGCGGGGAVSLLATKVTKGKVYGLDHSQDMVKLARKVNKRHIESGLVEIKCGSVSKLPFEDGEFNIVTAFETIEFWPNLNEDLKEVKRILRPGGEILIVNRLAGEKENRWSEFLQIRTSEEFRERLKAAGFSDISIDDDSREGWIAILASKP
jgi:SAM-dependent methyltransferase